MSDVIWQAIIAGIVTIILAWLNERTKKTVETVAKDAAKEVKDVKHTLEDSTAKQDDKLNVITEKVEEIHKATNSMKDQLVAKTEAEALARGGVEERARADAVAKKDSKDNG